MPRDDKFTLPRHPIGVAAERTRLSHDVLRVWERRYGAVHPTRGPAGQRLYSDADIERLDLLASATLAGRNISQVARLDTDELTRMVDEDTAARERIALRERATTAEDAAERTAADRAATPTPPAAIVDQALALTRQLDALTLDRLLHRAAALLGGPTFLDSVATPLLRHVGDEWHAGRLTPAHEHLASATVERIVTGLMRLDPADERAPRLLVATPAGEHHEIGAALAGAAAAAAGWRVIYLGADLPAGEIAGAAIAAGAHAVGVSIIYLANSEHVLGELRTLRARLPATVPLLAGGAGALTLAPELRRSGIRVVEDLPDFRAVLQTAAQADES